MKTAPPKMTATIAVVTVISFVLLNVIGKLEPAAAVGIALGTTSAAVCHIVKRLRRRTATWAYFGEPIAPARLRAIPWTRVCITCKEKQAS